METFNFEKKLMKANYIQYSPSGKWITIAYGNRVIILNAHSYDISYTFKEIKSPGKVAFSFNNENIFASQSLFKKIGVFNLDTMAIKTYKTTNVNEPQNYNIYFSPDDELIVCGIYNGRNNTLCTVALKTNSVKTIKSFENSFVNKIEYSDKNKSYLISVYNRGARIIKGEAYSETYILKWEYPFDMHEPLEIKSKIILEWRDISYNQKLNSYAAYVWVDQYNEMLIITDDTLEKELGRYVPDRRHGVFSNLNWSSDGKYIVITYLSAVKVIRTEDMKCIKDYKLRASYAEFANGDTMLLIAGGKNSYIIDTNEFYKL
jgi:WD40 repeat protein